MLNISELRPEVKQMAARVQFNVRDSAPARNQAYRQLKALGWTSDMELHPIDRVPIFRLNDATIRRDKINEFDWLVELDGDVYGMDGDLQGITEEVEKMTASPLHPADEIAADLIAELGSDLGGRVQRAVELVKAGQVDFPKYGTSYTPTGFHGYRSCGCPDATHRPQFTNFGLGCKHTLAQEIAHRIEATTERVAYQKHNDTVDLWRERGKALDLSKSAPAHVVGDGGEGAEDFTTNPHPKMSEAAWQAQQQRVWEAAHPVDDYAVREQPLSAYAYVEGDGSIEDWL